MMIEQDILRRSCHGLSIYRLVLRDYYSGDDPIQLTGSEVDLARNPFNKNRKTLKIYNDGGFYRYTDTELPDFNGGPFEFASLHYKIGGISLFKLLNWELDLNLDKRYFMVHAVSTPGPAPVKDRVPALQVPTVVEFSFFRAPIRNVYPFRTMNLVDVYKLIRSNAYDAITRQLREMKSPQEARAFKGSRFDYATFSGVFSSRKDTALSRHSRLITIDFDHIPDVQELKIKLLRDEFISTELLFVSPSGDGLKWIIPIEVGEMGHSDYFMAVANYLREAYKIEVDKSGKDLSRACFLPCDPEVYINPKYLTA